jgi:hypothetical protein
VFAELSRLEKRKAGAGRSDPAHEEEPSKSRFRCCL